MARKNKKDVAAAKAAKQKKILIVGSVLFVAIGAIQVPRTMKMLNKKPKPPIAAATAPTTTDPSATPSSPSSLAAPSLAAPNATAAPTTTSSTDLVSAVPVSADTGQLETFQRFASKDPFASQAPTSSSSGGSGSTTTPPASGGGGPTVTTTVPPSSPTTPSTPSAPSTPTVTTGVISVNGELASVQVGTDFPTSGTVFSRVGAIFHLVSLTSKAAKIAIAGGSYANGAQTIPLAVGKPVTLQNTADGTKYTLILEPQGTPVAATGSSGSTTTSTPTSTTPVVPSGSGG